MSSTPQALVTPEQFLAAAIKELSNQVHAKPLMDILASHAADGLETPGGPVAVARALIREGARHIAQPGWPSSDDPRRTRAEIMSMVTAIAALLILERTSVIFSVPTVPPPHHNPSAN
jgi:hypothetical protein